VTFRAGGKQPDGVIPPHVKDDHVISPFRKPRKGYMMDKAVSVEEDEQWDESGEEDEEEAGVDNC